MQLTIRKSHERGHADHDWLTTHHSFSFADYYDPEHMGFRSLRVINQDCVAPGTGFPMHAHRDMEIFSYVLEGELEHKDDMGNHQRLQPGDIQLMSAGTGIVHSEGNPSGQETSHFLQIWIKPDQTGLVPKYSEWKPKPGHENHSKVLMISPDGRDGSAVIHQDAEVWRIRLKGGDSTGFMIREGRGVWLQAIKGDVHVGSAELLPGDAASTSDPGELIIHARTDAELLLFDLK